MAGEKERLKNALDSMIYLPHLKDTQAHSVLAALLPDPSCPRGSGRPWDRGDLFRRLKTFRPATWFAKPESLSASECARRGWENTDVDKITCESCHAVVSCPIPPQLLPDEASKAGEQSRERMTKAHDLSCPWRGTVCSKSLLRFPEMPRNVMLYDFKDRLEGMLQLVCVPPLSKDAIDVLCSGALGQFVKMLAAQGPQEVLNDSYESVGDLIPEASEENLIQGNAVYKKDKYLQRLRIIALCGWSLEVLSPNPTASHHGTIGPESSALVCGLCGAKAGLWMFFPNCKPQAKATPGQGGQRFAASLKIASQSVSTWSQNIAIDLSTTIAGGPLSVGSEDNADRKDMNASESSKNQPVFGFEALQTKKRARDVDITPDNSPNQDKRQKQGANNDETHAGEPISIQYETLASDPLDPLSLHRSYCPWVHSPSTSSGQSRRQGDDSAAAARSPTGRTPSGWQWAVRQLITTLPSDRSLQFSGIPLLKDAGQEGNDDQPGGWDPSALLRSVLSKLDVKKV